MSVAHPDDIDFIEGFSKMNTPYPLYSKFDLDDMTVLHLSGLRPMSAIVLLLR